VAVAVPALELVVALCLLGNMLVRGGFLVATLLGASFVFVQASAIHRGLGVSCGCFGGGSGSTINYSTLLTSASILAAAATGLVYSLRTKPVPAPPCRERPGWEERAGHKDARTGAVSRATA
jgi:hypothetical protein